MSSFEERKSFAAQAFNVSSHYDSEIFKFFDGGQMSALKISEKASRKLRYGENPHHEGHFY